MAAVPRTGGERAPKFKQTPDQFATGDTQNSQVAPALPHPTVCADLLCGPDAGGVGDPLPGVDSSVDPDGPALRASSAELGKSTRSQTSWN